MPEAFRRGLAIAGGGVFAASLVYFTYAYAGLWHAAPDAGADPVPPLLANAALFAAFAVHHSVFARASVKARVVRLAPGLERTIYVWTASLLLAAMARYWQPVPGMLWHVDSAWSWALNLLQVAGAWIVFKAGRRFDVIDLAGMQPAFGPVAPASQLSDRGPYAVIRHPLLLGLLMMLWPMPIMNGARLEFAVLTTIYVLVAIPLEERDLRRHFGAGYQAYAQRVRWRLVPGVY
jgi:protein-S-isoprenylcysteine O-methyltransferase Ste14